MSGQHWTIFFLLGAAMAGNWFRVDQPREPVTVIEVFAGTLMNIIILMLLVWGQR